MSHPAEYTVAVYKLVAQAVDSGALATNHGADVLLSAYVNYMCNTYASPQASEDFYSYLNAQIYKVASQAIETYNRESN